MGIPEVALALLIIRIVSLVFVGLVVRRQIGLFKMRIASELVYFRVIMVMLAVVFALGHVLPIVTDYYYAFLHQSETFNILVLYAVSNALSGLAASVLLWKVYSIAGRELEAKQRRADAE